MSIDITCNSKNGVQLNTKDTICKDDIVVKPREANGVSVEVSNGASDVTIGQLVENSSPKYYEVAASISSKVNVGLGGWYEGGQVDATSAIVGRVRASMVDYSPNALEADIEMKKGRTAVTILPGYCSDTRKISVLTEEKTATENGTVTPTSGYLSKVTINVPPYAKEVSTVSEMNDLLVAENVGRIYKFTGTTNDVYTNGDLYFVEAVQ